LQRKVKICVIGNVFKLNREKALALNKTLSEYFRLAK
jgi:hypothetical protein